MDLERFERYVMDAVESLPPELLDRLENLEVVVEETPDAEQLESVGMSPPDTLLGLYEGVPLRYRKVIKVNVCAGDDVPFHRAGLHLNRRHRTLQTPAELSDKLEMRGILGRAQHQGGTSQCRLATAEEFRATACLVVLYVLIEHCRTLM